MKPRSQKNAHARKARDEARRDLPQLASAQPRPPIMFCTAIIYNTILCNNILSLPTSGELAFGLARRGVKMQMASRARDGTSVRSQQHTYRFHAVPY